MASLPPELVRIGRVEKDRGKNHGLPLLVIHITNFRRLCNVRSLRISLTLRFRLRPNHTGPNFRLRHICRSPLIRRLSRGFATITNESRRRVEPSVAAGFENAGRLMVTHPVPVSVDREMPYGYGGF